MPRPAPEIRAAITAVDVPLVAATEVVALQLDGISTENQDEDVLLIALATVTTAALTTALTTRLRRGTTVAGTLVGEVNAVVAGASVTEHVFRFGRDNPGAVAGQSYVLTIQATGPAANGSVLSSVIVAIVGATV